MAHLETVHSCQCPNHHSCLAHLDAACLNNASALVVREGPTYKKNTLIYLCEDCHEELDEIIMYDDVEEEW